MTRDEALAALSRAEVDYIKVQVESKTVWEFSDAEWKAKALRAAAELIRQGGWRPIAELADDDEYMTCGAWVNGQWDVTRVMLSKPRAIALGYTHYLPEPEPPAREVGESKNGEENDRQNQDNKCIG